MERPGRKIMRTAEWMRIVAELSCSGCDRPVDEARATSIAEFYGIPSPPGDATFCEDCMRKIRSEPGAFFMM